MYGHGLFNYCRDATIKNTGVVDSYVYQGIKAANLSSCSLGAIVSFMADEGVISQCYNRSIVINMADANSKYIAGICGFIDKWVNTKTTEISNCYNTGAIIQENSEFTKTGGICGGQYPYGYGLDGKFIGYLYRCYDAQLSNSTIGFAASVSQCYCLSTKDVSSSSKSNLFNPGGVIIAGDNKGEQLVDVLNGGLSNPIWTIKKGINNNLPVIR